MQYIAPLAKLIEHFRALPGIGAKSAARLAYHVLDMEPEKAKALARAIVEAKEKIGCLLYTSQAIDRNCVKRRPMVLFCGKYGSKRGDLW